MDRILVVDDEADFLATYERLLHRQGYRVVSTGSRREGLAIIEREPLALLISDLRLPDGDGLELVRAARARPRPTPAIIVPGFVSEASRLASTAAGAAAFLAKPFATSAFTSLVAETLGAR